MRKKLDKHTSTPSAIVNYGADVLDSDGYQSCANYVQHGDTSVRQHTISVALMATKLARKTHLKYDYQSLVRGALLHDYFLYDWHDKNHPKLHGFNHASIALHNAAEEYAISPTEADIIKKHMWPLNLALPRYRESVVVTIADKICSVKETFGKPFYEAEIQEIIDDTR